MIRSVRLLNWRSHSDSLLEFSLGTNLLIGMMGAGKSSVLEAIAFSLFGTFPSLERRKLKLDDILRLNEPKAQLILEFELDGSIYRVERTLERGKRGVSTSADLFKDDKLVEHGSTAVTDRIRELTRVDYDLFTRAIFSEQNNIDYFLTLDPKRRKQDIDTLLGLDKFEDARANAVTVSGRFKAKREVLEENFNILRLSELENLVKSRTETVSISKSRHAEILLLQKEKQSTINTLNKKFNDLRSKKDTFERLTKEESLFSGRIEQLRPEAALFNQISFDECKQRLSDLMLERSKLTEIIKSLDLEGARISREMGSTEAKIKASNDAKTRIEEFKKEQATILLGSSFDLLSQSSSEFEQKLLSLESERKMIENEILDLNDLLPKLKDGISCCPLCSSALTGDVLTHLKSEKHQEHTKKKVRLSELATLILTTRKDSESIKARTKRYAILSESILQLEKNLSNVDHAALLEKLRLDQVSLSSKHMNNSTHSNELNNSIESERISLAKHENLSKKKTELVELESKFHQLKDQLKTVIYSSDEFDTLRSDLESLKIEYERICADSRSIETQIKHDCELLANSIKEFNLMKESEQKLASFAKLETELNIFKSALLETQISLRSSLIEAINSAMNEIWPIFYPYKNYSALRLSATDKDYLFEVHENGEWKSLESVASGGERASAALALRVSLAVVLTPDLSWLILDEPTHNLDRETIELLSDTLQNKVPEVVKQTFVITHDEGLMGSEFASTYRLSRDKGNNGETKVEKV